MKNIRLQLILLSIASGLLFSLAWPERGFPGLLFIAFIPLLRMENLLYSNPQKFGKFAPFFYSYPAFVLWNGLTTWWIYNSTGQGAIMAIGLNAMFMSIIFSFFHGTRRRLRSRPAAYLALICYWVMLEYLHLNWDLNWPWLNLGNAFASYYKWVQWYEYTGAFGGTVWVLLMNILLYSLVQRWMPDANYQRPSTAAKQPKTNDLRRQGVALPNDLRRQGAALPNDQGRQGAALPNDLRRQGYALPILHLASCILLILLPISLSYYIYYSYHEPSRPVKAVIVQPNIDPYSEQYVLPPRMVVSRIMKLAGPALDSTVNLMVTPESALQQEMWENDMESFESVGLVRQIIGQYPGLNIIVGGTTYYAFRPGEKVPHTARKFTEEDRWYNRYNASIMVNSHPQLQLYHKSKLTPGVEILPSYKGFGWLEKYAIDLGGIVGSLGTDSVRRVYTTVNMHPVAACICYESIFGEFFAEFVRNGAEVMCIITNDGWWGNTAGHRQHFAFAHLRAIETRRSILRSANTGISAWIDQRGDAHETTKYWVPAVIKATVNANEKMTFYTLHGDYIAYWLSWLGALMFLGSFLVKAALRRQSEKK